ncbi:MAG: GlsB/YeaQ/YmgE family stress response membrane protein [Chloroflexota bacterium]|nr:MAG: GlsB/YeaQ/YmgE family stress response membrane protein [Chloroflexota bacterium]
MGPISWVIFGALAGWVASIVMRTNERQGCLANIVIGILDAFVGGLLIDLLGFGGVDFGWNWRSFGVAVLGAILLLAITGWGRERRQGR